LLLDIMEGDQTLFVHADETEASWRLYTPILESRVPPAFYEAGSGGPDAANQMIPGHGRRKNERASPG
jgi:glucose-6-phosphate 1-dehydrogenase